MATSLRSARARRARGLRPSRRLRAATHERPASSGMFHPDSSHTELIEVHRSVHRVNYDERLTRHIVAFVERSGFHWRVHVSTDMHGDWNLHWGVVDAAVVARGHATAADLCATVAHAPWTRPAENLQPEGSHTAGNVAVTTPMARAGGNPESPSSVTLTFYGPTAPAAVKFCLTDGRVWVKDDGDADFVVPLPVSWSERMSAYAHDLEESAAPSESKGFLAAALDTFGDLLKGATSHHAVSREEQRRQAAVAVPQDGWSPVAMKHVARECFEPREGRVAATVTRAAPVGLPATAVNDDDPDAREDALGCTICAQLGDRELLLHWGVVPLGGRNDVWATPPEKCWPTGTSPYEDRAARTPISSPESCTFIPMGTHRRPSGQAIRFVLRDLNDDSRWFDFAGGDFVVPIPPPPASANQGIDEDSGSDDENTREDEALEAALSGKLEIAMSRAEVVASQAGLTWTPEEAAESGWIPFIPWGAGAFARHETDAERMAFAEVAKARAALDAHAKARAERKAAKEAKRAAEKKAAEERAAAAAARPAPAFNSELIGLALDDTHTKMLGLSGDDDDVPPLPEEMQVQTTVIPADSTPAELYAHFGPEGQVAAGAARSGADAARVTEILNDVLLPVWDAYLDFDVMPPEDLMRKRQQKLEEERRLREEEERKKREAEEEERRIARELRMSARQAGLLDRESAAAAGPQHEVDFFASEPAATAAAGGAVDVHKPMSGTGSGREILLQGFNWESSKFKGHGNWYRHLASQAPAVRSLGATLIWMPPMTDSVSPEGYMPRDLYHLDSAYGPFDDLVNCVRTYQREGIKCLGDAVLNHRCASHQDENGIWNVFGGRAAWDATAICSDDRHYRGRGNRSTGDHFHAAPNLDHSQDFVQRDITAWLNYLRDHVGYDGWRLDYVRGFDGKFAKIYVEGSGAEFAVGEYWDALSYSGFDGAPDHNQDAHRQRIINWLNNSDGSCGAFDVTTKGILHAAVERCEYWRLADAKGQPPGVVGWWPSRAVTFVENHDTGSTQAHWVFPQGKELEGYAYILTHPGTPAIFWDHAFEWGDHYFHNLQRLVAARNKVGLHCRSELTILAAERSVYAAEVQGLNGVMRVKIGPGDYDGGEGGGWEVVEGDGNWKLWLKVGA